MKLYAIAEQYRGAMLALSEMDPEELSAAERQQLMTDTLGDIAEQFREKALNIGALIANTQLEEAALKTMQDRITQRRKAAERKATWLTDYLHTHMAHLGFDDLKNEQIRLKIKKTPPKVIVENADLIPDAYKETQVEVLIRKSLIAEDLKNGRPVPGTHLEAGTRLDIR